MNLYIRPVDLKDADAIIEWRNCPSVLKSCFNQEKITWEKQLNFYNDYVKTSKYIQFIIDRVDDDFPICSYPIATIYMKNINEKHRHCEFGMFTSNGKQWQDNYYAEVLQLFLNKVFKEYYMNKIYINLLADSLNEIKILEENKFRLEGKFKQEVLINGKYRDTIRMSMLREEYFKIHSTNI